MLQSAEKHTSFGVQGGLEDRLKKCGLKVTKTRLALLKVLREHHGPFSVQELHERLSTGDVQGKYDTVTLYRALAKMEQVDIVTKCDFGDNISRYELTCHKSHHHHIVCKQCKRVDSISNCPVVKSPARASFHGYQNVSHRLEFFGICPACM